MPVGQSGDEFYVDSPPLRVFIAEVHTVLARTTTPIEAVAALREPFSRLLADRAWLPSTFVNQARRVEWVKALHQFIHEWCRQPVA